MFEYKTEREAKAEKYFKELSNKIRTGTLDQNETIDPEKLTYTESDNQQNYSYCLEIGDLALKALKVCNNFINESGKSPAPEYTLMIEIATKMINHSKNISQVNIIEKIQNGKNASIDEIVNLLEKHDGPFKGKIVKGMIASINNEYENDKETASELAGLLVHYFYGSIKNIEFTDNEKNDVMKIVNKFSEVIRDNQEYQHYNYKQSRNYNSTAATIKSFSKNWHLVKALLNNHASYKLPLKDISDEFVEKYFTYHYKPSEPSGVVKKKRDIVCFYRDNEEFRNNKKIDEMLSKGGWFEPIRDEVAKSRRALLESQKTNSAVDPSNTNQETSPATTNHAKTTNLAGSGFFGNLFSKLNTFKHLIKEGYNPTDLLESAEQEQTSDTSATYMMRK